MARKNKALGEGLLGNTPKALRPAPRRKLKRQAARLMRKVYKAPLRELDAQEKKVQAISEKRKTDNLYYKQWLESQTNQINAHAQAADAALRDNQAQIQDQARQAHLELRDKLVESGYQHEGGVSNPNQAAAFDITPEAQKGQARIAAERQRSEQAIGSRAESAEMVAGSNAALAMSMEAKRQADLYNGLKDVASAKQKVLLERAAKTSEEVARLLDREITKAQSQLDMRQIAGQFAIDLKNLGLNKKKYRFDRSDKRADNRREDRRLNEDIRSNKADEKSDADKIKADSKADKAEGKKEKRELNRQVKRVVNNTISEIAARPNWQRLGARDMNALIGKLTRRGVDPIFARAAADLMFRGSLSMGSMRNLRQLGFNIPSNWK